jgi:hypothetical protein|tara:strand:+ start:246 stop:590 length:345 start_codon:yes stop_codon:yes gene_type:complete
MEIRQSKNVNGKGLFIKNTYKKNDIIHVLNGELLDSPTRESIHVGKNKHILDKFGIFMNHSFNPNTEIQGYNVVAIKDINPGDEITFDYNVSEVNMASPFKVNGIDVRGKNTSS